MIEQPEVITRWPRDRGGEFLVHGIPLARAVVMAGGTPCYLYDRQRIATRVASLRAILDPRVKLHYAIKANPMPALVGLMAGLVDGLDVASGGELGVALDSGTPADAIGFAGPGKREGELARAHAAAVLVNAESLRELRLLGALGREAGRNARVAFRVNPPFELKASGMRMSGGPKPFGLDPADLPAAMALLADGGLDWEGFHLYAGSQNLHADALIEAQTKSYEQALAWSALAPVSPRLVNLGGGFGIPYAARDRPLDVAPVIDHLNTLAARMERDLPGAHLVIELGRWLVGEAGLYVVRVIDRKLSHGETFLVTDGGMHQHLAASGNFGQVVRRNYPVAVNRYGGHEVASVVGPLCTPLDLLADRAELGAAEVGDLVVVFQSGAYGRSASPQAFLGHPQVNEALL